ncbi:MAG: diacylglycerol kinase family lipid kinase [Candidatus Sulfobium sp.]|jgi:diacylglycerol kinase (ATP)
MKSSVLIYNPAALRASARKIKRAQEFLEEKGFSSEVLLTEKSGHAEDLARECLKKDPDLIIAAGGDGTINEVMNGMVFSATPLAILPMGTTNVLAKELGIPENVTGSLERAVGGRPRRVSLGKIETGEGGHAAGRYFCLMAGLGFDGKAVHDVNTSIKKISGKTAYILSGMKSMLEYPPGEIVIRTEDREFRCYSAVVGKSSKYGGNFRITPDANLLDPFLYTCIFRGRNRTDILRYFIGIAKGTHLVYSDVEYVRSSGLEVRGRVHVQIDGDYLGMTPARIFAVKNALNLVW